MSVADVKRCLGQNLTYDSQESHSVLLSLVVSVHNGDASSLRGLLIANVIMSACPARLEGSSVFNYCRFGS